METFVISVLLISMLVAMIVPAILVLRRALARDEEMLAGLGESVTGRVAALAAAGPGELEADHRDPIGTFAVLAFYLMVVIGLWGAMYVLLLQRG